MMTKEELLADRPCQYIAGKKQPCVVLTSHLECLERLEILKAKNEEMRKELSRYGTGCNKQALTKLEE